MLKMYSDTFCFLKNKIIYYCKNKVNKLPAMTSCYETVERKDGIQTYEMDASDSSHVSNCCR